MFVLTTKKLGRNNFTMGFEGDTLHEALLESKSVSFWDIKSCGLCGKDDLFADAYKAGQNKEYDYTVIRCRDCGAKVTFGMKKDKTAMFLRKTEDKKLEWIAAPEKKDDVH